MRHRRSAVRQLLSIGSLILIVFAAGCSKPAAPPSAPEHTETASRPAGEVRPAPTSPVVSKRRVVRRDDDRPGAPDPDRMGPGGRPLPGTDYPGEAVRFRNLTLRDEQGLIPLDGPVRARAHILQMQAAGAAGTLPSAEPVAGISRSSWTWLGPGNIGGRIRTIAINPTTPATMFAGSVGGGIWKTTDTGASWAPVDDFLANLAVSSIVINPATPSVMFAGTGEGFYNGDGIRGAGVFKSVDGGTTWSQLSSTNNPNFSYVNRLAISPNGGTLLVATQVALFRSIDGGASFNAVLTSGVLNGMTDVAFNPADSTKAVASGFDGNAWYSIDSGATWTPAGGLPSGTFRRVEIAYAPSAPSTVYASVDVNAGSIYVSANGGVSYTFVSNPSQQYLSNQGWYGNALWVNPVDSNSIMVGGVDLYRSTNGGATLSKVSIWYNAPLSAHADHHAIVSPPNFNNTTVSTVFFGNDGGVYQAVNWSVVGGGGALDCTSVSPFNCEAGWSSLNHNLGVTQFYGGSAHSGTGRILGGTQDNGTLIYNGNPQAWITEFGGDGGFAAIEPTNANHLYGEYVYLALHRSLTGDANSDYIYGAFWNGSTYVCKPLPYSIPDVCSGSNSLLGHANFIAPFVLDPNAPLRLLAGGYSLWRTNDATVVNTSTTGPAWASIKGPDGTNPISAIAVAPGNSDIIWVGHNNGDIFKTVNGTAVTPTWTQMDNGVNPLPNRYVTRLTIDPTNANIVYATFGGYSVDNVYRTVDGGATWANRSGSGVTALPAVPVRDLKVLPTNSSWLYAASDAGVFASTDSGVTWGPPTIAPTDGPADVAVDELVFQDNQTLVAVTHGRGMFKTTVSAGAPGGHLSGSVKNAALAPLANVMVRVFDGTGSFVSSTTTDASGNYTSLDLNSGTYYATTSNTQGFVNGLYNGFTCAGCSPTSGTPITVTAPNTTPSINFVLSAGGGITGSVKDAGTNAALANVSVQVFNASGSFVTSGVSDASGNYTTGGLPSGNYFARTTNSLGYSDILFNNLPCGGGCNPTTGTAIAVTAPSFIGGINFALPPPPPQPLQGPNFGAWSVGEIEIPLSASGGNGTYAWSVTAGSLPPGISLRTDGPPWFPQTATAGLDGIATTPGTYNFRLHVTSGGVGTDQDCTLKVTALTIRDGNHFNYLPDGFVGSSYSYPMVALNGAGTLTWAASNLPPGVLLSSFGQLSGTPTTSGTYFPSVNVNDGTDTVTRGFVMIVYALKFTNPGVLPNAAIGQPYSTTLTVTGGTPPYTFTGCCAPNGLFMNSSGVISGTVSQFAAQGPTGLFVTATDAANRSVVQFFSIDVLGSPVSLPAMSPYNNLDDCTLGMPCSRGIMLSGGGTAPFAWTASNLPPGMAIRSSAGTQNTTVSRGPGWGSTVAAGDGEIFGTPTATGTFNVTVIAVDANGLSVSQVFPFRVSALAQPNAPNFTPVLNVPFSVPIRLIGGTQPYSGVELFGDLPAGITFNSNTMTLSGTPLETGFFGRVINFSDAASHHVQLTEGLQVSGPGATTITINNSTLGPAAVGSFFSSPLFACCANSYTWSFVSGTLPPGLGFSPAGVVSGTPTTPGTYVFIVKAADGSNPSAFGQKQVTMKVVPAGTLLTITTNSLPYGNVLAPYNQTLTATGGTGGITWSLGVNNYLPNGLTLASNGAITGTPTAIGQFSFLVTATDAGGQSVSRFLSIFVYASGGGPPLSLDINSNLGVALVGIFLQPLAASGGVPPYHYSLTPGANVVFGMRVQDGPPLPTNFSPSTTGGYIGVLPTPGTFNTSIRVTDSQNHTFDRAITLTATDLTILTTALPNATLNTSFNFTMIGYGGTGNYSWVATNLPAGMTMSTAGVLSGAPTAAGSFFTNVTVTDTVSQLKASAGFNLVVDPFAVTTDGVLPNAVVGVPYLQTLTAPNCASPCTWTPMNIFSGISLNSSGVLSGTPNATNSGVFSAQVTGSNGTVHKSFFLFAVSQGAPQPLSFNSNGSSSFLTIGSSVTSFLSASGGTPPYTFTVEPGSALPPGVVLFHSFITPGASVLTGRVMQQGVYNFTLRVTDANNATTTRTFGWAVQRLSQGYLNLPLNGNPLTYNTAYTQPLLGLGGDGNYGWAADNGILPGLTLSAAGVVSGTPANTGSFSAQVVLVDGSGNILTQFPNFTVSSGGTTTLGFGLGPNLGTFQRGFPLTLTLSPSGGTLPYSGTVVTPLPPGLTLECGDALQSGTAGTNCQIVGEPQASGSFTFTIRVDDAAGGFGVRTFTLNVTPFTLFTNTFLPDASVNVFYSQNLVAWDNTGTVAWSIAPGSNLPAGLTLSSGGLLSGTPTTPGSYSFSLTATDGANPPFTFTFNLRVSGIAITDPALLPVAATVGAPFTYSFTATGGSGPLTWSATLLPGGLLMSPSGTLSGTITSGSPTVMSIIVAVTDGSTTTSRRFGLALRVTSPSNLTFGLSNTILSDVTVGQNVAIPIAPSGGVPPYTWTVASGSSLPPGLHLVSGPDLRSTDTPGFTIIAGMPSAAGQYVFDLIATDAVGSQLRRTFHLNVSALNVAAGMRNAIVGSPFSQRFIATGGTQPYTYSITPTSLSARMLPQGLNFTSDGVIAGTPTNTGFYSFILHAQGALGEQFARTYSFTVTNANGLYISSSDPSDISVGRGGFIFFSVSNLFSSLGSKAFNWTITSGALPPGAYFESTGSVGDFGEIDIAGRVSVAGTYTFTLRATDVSDSTNFAERQFTIRVAPMQVAPPPIVPVLPPAKVGTPYSYTINVAGGVAPYSFSVSPFTPMPPGLQINTSTGVVFGTPTVSGSFNLQFVVQDSTPSTLTAPQITLDIAPANAASTLKTTVWGLLGPLGTRQGSVGAPMASPVIVIGGTPPYTYSTTGWPGVVLVDPNGGPAYLGYIPNSVTSGVATNFTVTVTDSLGKTASTNSSFNVSAIRMLPEAIPNGVVGAPYSTNLSATGGTGPYTFSLAGPSDLPPGLSLSASGALSGTPTASGLFLMSVYVSDSASGFLAYQYRIAIDDAAGQARGVGIAPRPITISYAAGSTVAPIPVSIPATGSTPFTVSVLGLPGVNPSVLSGTAPANIGLNLDPATLTTPGTYYGVLSVLGPASATQFDAALIALTVTAPLPTTVDATPTTIDAGATLTVTWTNIPGPANTDWIALVPVNASDGSYVAWHYLNGAASGTTTLVVPSTLASGSYDVRLFAHDTLQRLARSGPITVNGATLTVAPSTTSAGATVTLSWDHVGAPTASDWIAFAPAGSPNTTYDPKWIYTTGTVQGSLPYAIPANAAPGQYEFHLFSHDTFQRLATSNVVTVVPVTVSVTPASILPGESITVSWSGIGVPTATDWIAVVPTGAGDPSYFAWRYSTGTSSGSASLTLPLSFPPGVYDVRLFAKDTLKRLAISSTTFTVRAASLTASPSTVASGGTLTLSWADIAAPTPADWLALEPIGANDGGFVAWVISTGHAKDARTLPIPPNVPAGTYEVRLFANNTFRHLAISNQITITGPGPSVSAGPASVAPGGGLTVSWRNIAAPTATDWVGVYEAGAADNGYVARFYTTGRASDLTVTTLAGNLTPDTYELRLFSNDSLTRLATSNAFSVAPGPTLAGSPGTVAAGSTLTVSWAGISSPTATDWVALVAPTAADGSFVAWSYTTGTASGSRGLPIPANTPAGTYELRLFAQDSFQRLAISSAVVVGSTVVATPATAAPGAMATVSWTGISTPTAHDWLALVPLNAPDTSYVAWMYTNGRAADRMLFALPANLAAGLYDVRLFANDTFTRLAISNVIAVGGSAPTVTVHPLTAAGGSTLTLDWHGIAAPTAADWIGVFPSGADDASYVTRTFTTGSASGTTTIVLPGSVTAGDYEVRLFSNNSSTRLAIGNGFAVVAGAAVQVISSTTVAKGGSITINWAGIAAPTATDWVALVPMNGPDASYVSWIYTGGAAAGTVSLPVPSNAAAGAYEVRLFAHDTFQHLAISNVVTIVP